MNVTNSLIENIKLVKSSFKSIRDSIVAKGIDVPRETSPSEYGNFIDQIKSGCAVLNEALDPWDVYVTNRPSDWLKMPYMQTEVPNFAIDSMALQLIQNDEIFLLFHMPINSQSLIAFTVTCSGQYRVDIGTMTNGYFVSNPTFSSTLNSGNKYQNSLSANDFIENVTSDGFAQCMIKISGSMITMWEPSTHSQKPTPDNYSNWCIMEFAGSLPKATRVNFSNSGDYRALTSIRFFNLYGKSEITSMNWMFSRYNSLISVPSLDTSKVVSMDRTFNECFALLATPFMDTANVTTMSGVFASCESLTSIHKFDTKKVTNFSDAFSNCRSLINIPEFDTGMANNMVGMFNSCTSLKMISQLDTKNVTNMAYMCSSCHSLIWIADLNTSKVQSMISTFESCYSLLFAPNLNFSAVREMSNLFSNCRSLRRINALDIRSINTSISNSFSGLVTCSRITFVPGNWTTPQDIDISNNSLLVNDLILLFQSLPTASYTRSLKITNNPGVSSLTTTDRQIATAKNWQLVTN